MSDNTESTEQSRAAFDLQDRSSQMAEFDAKLTSWDVGDQRRMAGAQTATAAAPAIRHPWGEVLADIRDEDAAEAEAAAVQRRGDALEAAQRAGGSAGYTTFAGAICRGLDGVVTSVGEVLAACSVGGGGSAGVASATGSNDGGTRPAAAAYLSDEHAQPVGWWQDGTLHDAQPPGVSYALYLPSDADRDQAAAVAAERERWRDVVALANNLRAATAASIDAAVAEARASTRAGIIAALGSVMTCPCCLKQMDCADDCTFSVDCPSESQALAALRDAVREEQA